MAHLQFNLYYSMLNAKYISIKKVNFPCESLASFLYAHAVIELYQCGWKRISSSGLIN